MAAIVPLREAVASLVRDNMSVALEGFTHLIPFAAGHELIRQRRRNFTLIRMTPDLIYDQMIGMGCAARLVFSWGGNPGVGSLHRFRDAIQNRLAESTRTRRAQSRGYGRAISSRRFGTAVCSNARIRRVGSPETQSQNQIDHLSIYGRVAHRNARSESRRHDHSRAEGRSQRQRPHLRDHRNSKRSRAGRKASDRHGRRDRGRSARRR